MAKLRLYLKALLVAAVLVLLCAGYRLPLHPPSLLPSGPFAGGPGAACAHPTGRLPNTSPGSLTSVVAFSPHDVWTLSRNDNSDTEVHHWDGRRWRIVPGVDEGVQALGGRSTQDIWVVGGIYHIDREQPLAERWDGTRWQAFVMGLPKPVTGDLAAVAADRLHDVWAVGSQDTIFGQTQDLVEHWDGTRWQEVPSPNPGRYGSYLTSVAALAPDDAWAVGTAINAPKRTLTLHWDGRAWRVVPSPNPSRYDNILYAVAAHSPRDIWAVGGTQNPSNAKHTIAEHWDGTRWRLVPGPPTGCTDTTLYGVTAISTRDVWAVGAGTTADGSYGAALTEHWDGTRWRLVPNVNAGAAGSVLSAVAASSTRDIWAVGYAGTTTSSTNVLGELTLAERWDGHHWRLVGM